MAESPEIVNLHWARIKEAGALTGMRIMVLIHAVFGRAVFKVILYPVMAYFYLRRGEARRASIEYLGHVKRQYPEILGNQSLLKLSFLHLLTFGDLLLDKYLAWVKSPPVPAMTPATEAQLLQLVDGKQGCLVLGSHFGNLEYSRGIATRHSETVINVLIYDQHATKFAGLMAASEPTSRLNLIQVTDVDVALALDLKERVKRGEWVVIAGDRVPVGDSTRVCRVPFLGEDAPFPIGPYVLAAVLECPVYLFYCYRLDDRYHMGLELFADRIELPRENRGAAIESYVRHYARALETQVTKAPLQWFNFFDFWSK
jgi:predicted LPLAT superfamily acyltransferase